MATARATVDHLTDLLSDLGPVRALPMFEEYGLYVGVKLVRLICDDRLYLKPLPVTQATGFDMAPPYPGAKPHVLVPEEMLEDRDALTALLRAVHAALPQPKKFPKRLQ
ncbi:TfoX/Sxy family protein [Pseudooceanicola sp. C21-150M6]|uniref:TfoX/Sxy family protein n=1 Tax=Pseudooceanicola sp. C21-150M6 TaxID=3434355 RepID=UPI003D7F7E04